MDNTPVIFRNDDVSVETDLERFKEFCSLFHRYGFTQLHGVTPFGHTHPCKRKSGEACIYEGVHGLNGLANEDIVRLSAGKSIEKNGELIRFLNESRDSIALHGLYHTDFSTMSEAEQGRDISAGLDLLRTLFPGKPVRDFIPPFNKYNDATVRACRKHGLRLHDDTGQHLEYLIHHKIGWEAEEGTVFRYHHHRFYPDSPFRHYSLSLRKLRRFLMHITKKPLISIEDYKECVSRHGATAWYGYAYERFEELDQCCFPYEWVRDNINRTSKILETGCGAGGVLHMLWHEGFVNLSGYDIEQRSINAARDITKLEKASINFQVKDCTQCVTSDIFDVILGMNWIYNIDNFSLDEFFSIYSGKVAHGGYLIFDTIDDSYNNLPLNMFHTSDWKKPERERRKSEYRERLSEKDAVRVAEAHGLTHVATKVVEYVIPRNVIVVKKT